MDEPRRGALVELFDDDLSVTLSGASVLEGALARVRRERREGGPSFAGFTNECRAPEARRGRRRTGTEAAL
ncbi:hypothetical protein [Actinomadura rubrisoli]|uniref:Uncharacterized protein n=1 Tax=Actinomadura rubrisoli TaxID=2530368 RepID=A0A4R5B5H5_9ACTN|nr:hypothetical protein [Actinomadura rubrisoli]TDD79860.1 hypothetical protein E1298_26940 [Actinomadura rubrisoli]